jgi:hypothetical protein
MGLIRCPETLVNNYHTTPCNNPEDHGFHQHHGGSLKSRLTDPVLTAEVIYYQIKRGVDQGVFLKDAFGGPHYDIFVAYMWKD